MTPPVPAAAVAEFAGAVRSALTLPHDAGHVAVIMAVIAVREAAGALADHPDEHQLVVEATFLRHRDELPAAVTA